MNPRPPHVASSKAISAQEEKYQNVDFSLIATKMYNLKVSVKTAQTADPNKVIHEQVWNLNEVFMSPITKWHDIVEAIQASKSSEWPIAEPHIEPRSLDSALVTVRNFTHRLRIVEVRKT